MKIILVLTLAFSSAILMAAEPEKSLFEISSAHLAKIAAAEKQAENSALESVLSILESDRPELKANGVNTESRSLKAGAAEATKTL